MTAAAFAAACFAAATAGTIAWRVIDPRRPPEARIAPHLLVARRRLGVPVDVEAAAPPARDAARRVLGPLAASVGRQLTRIAGVTDPDALARQLRQAGLDLTVDGYRRARLRWLIVTPLALGLLGALLGSTTLAVALFLLGGFVGWRQLPQKVAAATRRRCTRIRSDLPVIAAVLSPKLANAKSLAVALRSVCTEGSGPVVDDLERALRILDTGQTLDGSLEQIAAETPEPAAARFYQFLAASVAGGLDLPAALLDQANELRNQRREEVERLSAKKQMTMTLPMVALMIPVTVLFMLAPIPKELFGI